MAEGGSYAGHDGAEKMVGLGRWESLLAGRAALSRALPSWTVLCPSSSQSCLGRGALARHRLRALGFGAVPQHGSTSPCHTKPAPPLHLAAAVLPLPSHQ